MNQERFDELLDEVNVLLKEMSSMINKEHAQQLLQFFVEHGLALSSKMSRKHEEWMMDLINYFDSHHFTRYNCEEFLSMCDAFIRDMNDYSDLDI